MSSDKETMSKKAKFWIWICGFYDQHKLWISPLIIIILTILTATFTYNFDGYLNNIPKEKQPIFYLFIYLISEYRFYPLCLFVLLVALEQFIKFKNDKTIRELEEKNNSCNTERDEALSKLNLITQNIEQLFIGQLVDLSQKLQFGTNNTNSERITLYIHDGKDSFVPCGRYSANPVFEKRGRTKIPDTEGIIAKAWQNGWHFQENFDKNNCKECNISVATYQNFNMKSVVLASIRLGIDSTKIAVIVVESNIKDRFNEKDIKDLLEGSICYIARTVHKFYEYIPSLKNAKDKGL